MKLDFGLQMQQEQKLVMTQQLQLAVKILQLSSYELNEYIDEQVAENPLLELDEIEKNDNSDEKFEDVIKYLNDDGYNDYYSSYQGDEDDEISPFNFVASKETLWDYLRQQLNLMPISGKIKRLADYIIDNIDEHGYLTVDENEIMNKGCINKKECQDIIEIIQSLDPPGICARNINECLMLQIKNKDLYDNIIENIVNNMLEDVGEGKISKISKVNSISCEKAQEYVDIIKTLDPKPGVRFSTDTIRYIVPDVYVEKTDGKYIVTVNEDGLPKIKINKIYKRMINDKGSAEYKYVKDRLQAALWIMKSIDQRVQTIKKVVEAIVHYQMDFFEYDTDLKPLALKQIADVTEVHESTVSRATKGKYVQTPKGLFEIKNFFVRGVYSSNGEEFGASKIKHKIKELIETENESKPFSDQELSDILKVEGMAISRRTVAKYREEINIPSSSKRKRK